MLGKSHWLEYTKKGIIIIINISNIFQTLILFIYLCMYFIIYLINNYVVDIHMNLYINTR